MQLICAIVRPERAHGIVKALENGGYNAFSEWGITGRGRQRGIQVGPVFYEEMPKRMLYIVVRDEEKDEVVDIILHSARTGEADALATARFSSSPLPNPIQSVMIFNR